MEDIARLREALATAREDLAQAREEKARLEMYLEREQVNKSGIMDKDE